ncbi:TonB-dependent receptor [Sphingobium sp. TomTYG75]
MAQAQENQLQDIVVTAQKRAQNVQDTPLSVTAVSGDQLTSVGITTVQELNRVDPALQIGQAAGTATTFIRGIGNPVATAGNEASVPVYIDDVYFIRAAVPFFDLTSVERVEVLKGPQGTLFGRNASGGVISIYTKDPSQNAELEARLGYANYQTMDAKFYLNMPITENLAANISASYHNQDKGWGKNRTLVDHFNTSLGYLPSNDDYWKGRSFSTRGKILWDPVDGLSVKLIGYYQNSWNQIGIYARPFPGTVGGSPDPMHAGFGNSGNFPVPSQELPSLGFYDVALGSTQKMYDKSEGYGFSGRIDYELGFADIVSITAYRKNIELYASAGNYSPYDWARYDLNIVDNQFSQEFQLKSKAGSPVSWIAGLYYLNADGGFDPTTIYGPGIQALLVDSINIRGEQNVKSYAAFGQLTYPITDNTNVTGGLRYTTDRVAGRGTTTTLFIPELPFLLQNVPAVAGAFGAPVGTVFDTTTANAVVAGAQTPVDNVPGGGVARKTFKKWTWKASIDHKFSDDIMVYANYSRGYKAGTFNTLPLDQAEPLSPEVVDAYEIGFKTELADRRIRLNGALFWNDINNPQVQAQSNGLVFLKNAGSARTRGAELDLTAVAAEGLTLRLAGTYLIAKFRDFPDAPSYCPNPQVDAVTCQALTPNMPLAPGNLNSIVVDASDNYMPYASKWKFSGGFSYDHNFADDSKITLDVNANWSDKFNWDADNVIKEPSHLLLDGSVSFTPAAAEHLTFRFWMKNITGEKFNINYYAQDSGSAFSSAPGTPRTYGGELIFKF